MVADDDRSVRKLIVTLLTKAGYHALGAADGVEAEAIIRLLDRSASLIICDIQMPAANGLDLAASLQLNRPELPVLFISGLIDSIAVLSITLTNPAAILTKPFDASDLLERVANLVSAPPPACAVRKPPAREVAPRQPNRFGAKP